MEVIINDVAQYEKQIEVKVPYQNLQAKIDEAYNKYKKSIQLEGFRRGKVPLHLIKKVFGTKIEREVAENSISDFLKQAIEENKVKFHNLQKIESVDFNKNDGLKFDAIVRVEPEVELVKYKGLKLEKESYQITDDDINVYLENLRERHTTLENVEGEAKEDNFIVADLQKTDQAGHPMIGDKYENRYFQLSGENVDNRIAKQLIGVKAGDIRQITVQADNDNRAENEFYSVSVKEVKKKILPTLDDEFAKDLGDFENLAALKEKVRDNLEKQTQAIDKQKYYHAVMDQIIKNNPVDLPDFMIEDFLTTLVENAKSKNQNNDVDENALKERYRADAIWNLKWRLLRDKISETEKIEVKNEEISAEIEKLISEAGTNGAKVRAYYKEEHNRDQVWRELIDHKIVDYITANGKVKEKTVTYQDEKKKQELITQ